VRPPGPSLPAATLPDARGIGDAAEQLRADAAEAGDARPASQGGRAEVMTT